ncbi:hypothetical protein [Dictyobacter arantiisoli]|uniref:Uncharacterized protein n=1 Tax=Dictyobacter arantiisoli TaxID=2014874 RepID=A0A5A5TIM2_9CHLR|nr:hypothetical protein [Dictyobacter arantiisoli]GCF10903.1 hypothetical protein KDI_44670 [Dictyobacter arantiisoli]
MSACENPLCSNELETIPGHRARRYCSDACKQTAYRLRQDEAARQTEERARQELKQQEMEALRDVYGDLLPGTIDFFYHLGQRGHSHLVQSIGWVIRAERDHALQSEDQERSQLIEEIMMLGERMGYSGMTLGRLANCAGPGDFAILGGVDCWSKFVSHASREMLRQARDTAYYHVEGYQKSRQRLKELSKQS